MPTAATDLWYLHYHGQKLGPYHWEQVAQYFADCGKPAGFLVWTEGFGQWTDMREVVATATAKATPAVSPALLSVGLLDLPPERGGTRAGLRSTARSSAPLSVSTPTSASTEAAAEPVSRPTPQASKPDPAPVAPTGWVESPVQRPVEVTEPEIPLDEQFAYRVPGVRKRPPLFLAVVLIVSCALTYHFGKQALPMTALQQPFTLRCSYFVEALGNSSIRQPIKIQAAGSKFRASTPQILKDTAVFDGQQLTIFAKSVGTHKRGSRYQKTVHRNPQPKLLREIMVWIPRIRGEAIAGPQLAGRNTKKLVETVSDASRATRTEEWVDAQHGMVLKRLETTTEGAKVIEKKVFQCSRVTIGPLPRGTFKERP